MLDAVKVCGRWVCTRFLKRFSRLTQQENPPSRPELIERFCYAAGWLEAKGRPWVGTASVGLARLEKQGHLLLPPRPAQPQRPAPRSLPDDGEALPSLPQLPRRAEAISGWRVHWIDGANDPKHPLWNRLMGRAHPLRSRPLVGAQLRYLIACDFGLSGALGFGPPAFHLACRDQWIGWSPQAMERNRPRIIGLSRFLIRPGLRCANLASRCYGLLLRRVASDWEGRYDVRPVWVETPVERQNHNGRSLAAANWRRLGQSAGRGRDDRPGQKLASVIYTPEEVRMLEALKKKPLKTVRESPPLLQGQAPPLAQTPTPTQS